jgi:ABC transport system ATP-binding/permease protein
MSELTLKNISISFGAEPILDKINLTIHAKDRLCIVGRNGMGKSTLLNIIAGNNKPDEGEMIYNGHVVTAMLAQEVPQGISQTLYDFLRDEDTTLADWQIDKVLGNLQLDGQMKLSELSGGQKRRALLAKALVKEPDILMMDEPTNHLDLAGIEWLEQFVKKFNGTLIFITHDRTFLQNTATRIVEIDRGKLLEFPGDYANYLNKKAQFLDVEEDQNKKFDQKLAQEEAWLRQGIKARRTRNEGRVRALKQLREAHRARREQIGKADFNLQQLSNSGKLVLEAKHISYGYSADKLLIRDFSLTILRGDKIGIIGSNGSGKSTLIQLLLGEKIPSTGTIKHGTKLEIAYFDQHRAQLDLERTVAENVSYGEQYVMCNGKPQHVIGYLQQFLFSPTRANTPVKALSGGERNRLILAKLFSKPANFLIMDEPTNDLDLETLELLEELLVDYPGTLLLVSHDRSFLNNVVTSTLVLEGNGKVAEYIGGYDDWLRQRPCAVATPSPSPSPVKPIVPTHHSKTIKTLEQKIEKIEQQLHAIELELAAPELYLPENKTQLTQAQTKFADLKQLRDVRLGKN